MVQNKEKKLAKEERKGSAHDPLKINLNDRKSVRFFRPCSRTRKKDKGYS